MKLPFVLLAALLLAVPVLGQVAPKTITPVPVERTEEYCVVRLIPAAFPGMFKFEVDYGGGYEQPSTASVGEKAVYFYSTAGLLNFMNRQRWEFAGVVSGEVLLKRRPKP